MTWLPADGSGGRVIGCDAVGSTLSRWSYIDMLLEIQRVEVGGISFFFFLFQLAHWARDSQNGGHSQVPTPESRIPVLTAPPDTNNMLHSQ